MERKTWKKKKKKKKKTTNQSMEKKREREEEGGRTRAADLFESFQFSRDHKGFVAAGSPSSRTVNQDGCFT